MWWQVPSTESGKLQVWVQQLMSQKKLGQDCTLIISPQSCDHKSFVHWWVTVKSMGKKSNGWLRNLGSIFAYLNYFYLIVK